MYCRGAVEILDGSIDKRLTVIDPEHRDERRRAKKGTERRGMTPMSTAPVD